MNSEIRTNKPEVLKSYKVKDIVGSKEVFSKGGQVKTIKLVQGFSTSKLIKKIKNLDS